MGILGAALRSVRSVVQQFLNDPAVRELVTYKLWKSQEFSKDAGHNIDTYLDSTDVRTLRLIANEKLVQSMFASLSAGEVLFLMDAKDVPAGASQKDQIVDANGIVFKINDLKHVFGIVVAFRAEGST